MKYKDINTLEELIIFGEAGAVIEMCYRDEGSFNRVKIFKGNFEHPCSNRDYDFENYQVVAAWVEDKWICSDIEREFYCHRFRIDFKEYILNKGK